MVSTLGSQPRCSGFQSQADEDKWGCILKHCKPCSPNSKISTGVSRGFVILHSRQEQKAGNPILLYVCVCVW